MSYTWHLIRCYKLGTLLVCHTPDISSIAISLLVCQKCDILLGCYRLSSNTHLLQQQQHSFVTTTKTTTTTLVCYNTTRNNSNNNTRLLQQHTPVTTTTTFVFYYKNNTRLLVQKQQHLFVTTTLACYNNNNNNLHSLVTTAATTTTTAKLLCVSFTGVWGQRCVDEERHGPVLTARTLPSAPCELRDSRWVHYSFIAFWPLGLGQESRGRRSDWVWLSANLQRDFIHSTVAKLLCNNYYYYAWFSLKVKLAYFSFFFVIRFSFSSPSPSPPPLPPATSKVWCCSTVFHPKWICLLPVRKSMSWYFQMGLIVTSTVTVP